MIIRNLALITTLTTFSVAALATPVSAQTYGGVTLSFGSGAYGGYDDDDDDGYVPGGYYADADPRYRNYRYYYDQNYAWQEHQRREQVERWREEQRRRQYWANERRERQQWRDRDEDGD